MFVGSGNVAAFAGVVNTSHVPSVIVCVPHNSGIKYIDIYITAIQLIVEGCVQAGTRVNSVETPWGTRLGGGSCRAFGILYMANGKGEDEVSCFSEWQSCSLKQWRFLTSNTSLTTLSSRMRRRTWSLTFETKRALKPLLLKTCWILSALSLAFNTPFSALLGSSTSSLSTTMNCPGTGLSTTTTSLSLR